MSDTEYEAYRITTRQLDASWDRLWKRSKIAHRAMIREQGTLEEQARERELNAPVPKL